MGGGRGLNKDSILTERICLYGVEVKFVVSNARQKAESAGRMGVAFISR